MNKLFYVVAPIGANLDGVAPTGAHHEPGARGENRM